MVIGTAIGKLAGGPNIGIIISAIDDFSKTFDKAGKNVNKLGKDFSVASSIIMKASIALAAGIGGFATASIYAAAQLEPIKRGFQDLAKNSNVFLKELESATQGTVTQFELMKAANNALLLGIDQKALPQMFKTAAIIGQAAGRTTVEALNDISLGTARQSRLILDNIGIIVRADIAHDKFAKTNKIVGRELTETEKTMAFMNEIMFQLEKKGISLGGVMEDTFTVKLGRAKKSINDLAVSFGNILLPAVSSVVDSFTSLINKFNSLSDEEKKGIGIGAGVVAGAGVIAGGVMKLRGMTRQTPLFVEEVGLGKGMLGGAGKVAGGVLAGVSASTIGLIAAAVAAVVLTSIGVYYGIKNIKARNTLNEQADKYGVDLSSIHDKNNNKTLKVGSMTYQLQERAVYDAILSKQQSGVRDAFNVAENRRTELLRLQHDGLKVLNEQEQNLVDKLPELQKQLIYGEENAIVLADAVNQLNTVAPVAADATEELADSLVSYAEGMMAMVGKIGIGGKKILDPSIEGGGGSSGRVPGARLEKLAKRGYYPSEELSSMNPAARINAQININIDNGTYVKSNMVSKKP